MSCDVSPAGAASGVTPGLGFLHLSVAKAQVGSGGVRGAPKGVASASNQECCNKCAAHPSCSVWLQRAEGKCYLGNCSTSAGLACLERMRPTPSQKGQQPTAGTTPRKGARTLLCSRPAVGRSPAASDEGTGLALLLLGHRSRLMFSTLVPNVVRPVVAAGSPLDLFALLENSTMAKAFRGRRPVGNPEFATLSDDALAARVTRDVEAAGGHVARIRIGPRPVATLPDHLPDRLSRYSDHVKTTVATRFLKEKLGLEMVLAHEAAHAKRYAWVLWTREDSHWFSPLVLSRFARGGVHGKACGGFGGWNDKVWLMDRTWAPAMLGMYDEFHAERHAKCTDLAAPAGSRCADGECTPPPLVDFLAAPSVEQFRERVGRLRRVPFTKHPPEYLPTMDSYYRERAPGDWQLCFPRIYAKGCVPGANQSAVDERHSCA